MKEGSGFDLRIGDKYEVISDNSKFKKGEVITLIGQEDSGSPLFVNMQGEDWFVSIHKIKPIDNRKVTMPKFFDEWVKGYNVSNGAKLVYILVSEHMESELSEDMEELFESREEDCYRALLDEYEVEKEQLYTVYCGGNKGLIRNCENDIVLRYPYYDFLRNVRELTQLEIENSEHAILMGIAEEVGDE